MDADRISSRVAPCSSAFTSKLAVALFEAVQDTRHMSMQISRQIEGLEHDLPTMIKRIVAQSNAATISETINRLRVEETALKPQAGISDGYGGGEAEKSQYPPELLFVFSRWP